MNHAQKQLVKLGKSALSTERKTRFMSLVAKSFTSQAKDQYVNYNKRMYGNFMYQKRYRFNVKDGQEPERQQHADEFQYDWNVFSTWDSDLKNRYLSVASGYWSRRHRLYSKFNALHLGAVSVLYSFYGGDAMLNLMFYLSVISGVARNKSRLRPAEIDEVAFRDMIHGHDELGKLFGESTMHLMNADVEYDLGFRDDTPEYDTQAARFFNTDCNFTTGHWVVGDVESGAYAKIHFKTMPYSTMRYVCNHPFKIYACWAEVMHEGNYKKVMLVDPRDVKVRPFVMYS